MQSLLGVTKQRKWQENALVNENSELQSTQENWTGIGLEFSILPENKLRETDLLSLATSGNIF